MPPHDHDQSAACRDGLCHLNAEAQARYRKLMSGGCPEQAQRLSREGVWA